MERVFYPSPSSQFSVLHFLSGRFQNTIRKSNEFLWNRHIELLRSLLVWFVYCREPHGVRLCFTLCPYLSRLVWVFSLSIDEIKPFCRVNRCTSLSFMLVRARCIFDINGIVLPFLILFVKIYSQQIV